MNYVCYGNNERGKIKCHSTVVKILFSTLFFIALTTQTNQNC